MQKTIYFFGTNATATANGTISSTTLLENAIGQGLNKLAWNKCNVLLNFNTITSASTGTITASFREYFSGVGYVETAKTGTITTIGNYWLMRYATNATQMTNQWGSFPSLGTGMDKEIVFTNSTIQAVSVDAYIVYYQD